MVRILLSTFDEVSFGPLITLKRDVALDGNELWSVMFDFILWEGWDVHGL